MPCADLPGYDSFRGHLEDVLGNPRGEPIGGADVYPGGSAVFLYLSCNETSTSLTDEAVGGTAKTAVHELIHVHQVQKMRGLMTSITPPLFDPMGYDDRFYAKRYNNRCPAVYEEAVKGVLRTLPQYMKLLTVPTYAILVPETRGIGNENDVQYAADELERLMFPSGCASGVTFNSRAWLSLENGMMAKGEAEYHAANVLLAPTINPYNVDNMQWDGAADWSQRMVKNMQMMDGSPGKQLLHLPLQGAGGTQEWSDKLDCLGWKRNPVGEITYHYMKTVWRPATTHEEMRQHWINVYNEGTYEGGFELTFGRPWHIFVCDFETYYDIDRRLQTCGGTQVVPDTSKVTCATEGGGPDAGAIVGITLGSLAAAGLVGWMAFAYWRGVWPFKRARASQAMRPARPVKVEARPFLPFGA